MLKFPLFCLFNFNYFELDVYLIIFVNTKFYINNTMGTYGKGMVEIPLEDFWEIVNKFSDPRGELYLKYGVPRVNNSNQTIEIDYMFNSEIPVGDQYGYETCDIANQWKNHIDKTLINND